jgi:hypothetical protein
MRVERGGFRALTVGWEPDFIQYLLVPLGDRAGFSFTHGLVGNASRLACVRERYPHLQVVALSKTALEPLPAPDLELLASLECKGVPTIRSMIQGDRVLRHRPEEEALGYATMLARRMHETLLAHKPDLILGSYDSLHAAMSLAVARSLGIPWVAMAFSVIPDDRTGFCFGLTPDSLLPLTCPVDGQLLELARTLVRRVRSREQKVLAYRPPSSLMQWVRQYIRYSKNLVRRGQRAQILGIDRFTYPSVHERLGDLGRRQLNRLRLPSEGMLNTPPAQRFIYYPFHMAPESMLDTWAPFYQDQIGLITQLSRAVPADLALVVKLHFSDPDNYTRGQLKRLMRLPRLYIAHPNASGSAFIEKAALVVGIQGTSCLEAALLGKPVLIFGDSPYQHFPRTERAKLPDQWFEQIRRLVDQPAPSDDEIVDAYAKYMARYMPGRINDWGRAMSPEETHKYVNCFRALCAHLNCPGVRENWYSQFPLVFEGQRNADQISAA